MCLISLAAFNIFSLDFINLFTMYLDVVFLCAYSAWDSLRFLAMWIHMHYSLFSTGILIICMLDHLILFYRSLKCCLFVCFLISLSHPTHPSIWIISAVFSSCSPSFSSTMSCMLILSPSREFFISDIVLFQFRISFCYFGIVAISVLRFPVCSSVIPIFSLLLDHLYNGCFEGLGSISTLLGMRHICFSVCLIILCLFSFEEFYFCSDW